MTQPFTRRGAAAAALGAIGALPIAFAGAASAAATPATLSVDKACYVTAQTRPMMTLTGSGYPAGQEVDITDKIGDLDTETTADATGAISVTVKAPRPLGIKSPGVEVDTITASSFDDTTGIQYQGTTTANLSVVAALHGATAKRPGLQAFGERTLWAFSGFPGKTIYGHFTYRGALVATESFGKAQGPCGVLRLRRKLLPVTPRHQNYAVQLDASKRFSKSTQPRISLTLNLSVF